MFVDAFCAADNNELDAQVPASSSRRLRTTRSRSLRRPRNDEELQDIRVSTDLLHRRHRLPEPPGKLRRVSKNCAKLFLSELRQISTNFDNFWQKDGKEGRIMPGALTFHLT